MNTATSASAWRTAEARGRMPVVLVPTHDGLCSPSEYRAGCAGCMWLKNDKTRWQRAQPGAREARRASGRVYWRKRLATAAGREAARASESAARGRYRARTRAEADADFARLRPGGKTCRACGESLPAEAFRRDLAESDGRVRLCDRNGCRRRYFRLKRDLGLREHWIRRGIDPDVCIYCQAAPYEELEHVYPRSLGGTDSHDNLAPSCELCNRGVGGKFDHHPVEWLRANHPHRVAEVIALFPHINDLPT